MVGALREALAAAAVAVEALGMPQKAGDAAEDAILSLRWKWNRIGRD